MEDNELTLAEAIESGLKQLTKGMKKVELDAYQNDAFTSIGGKKVEVSIYWAGPVARVDIKGLK